LSLLGDGTTRLAIQGVGTVICHVGEHILRLENVRFAPSLLESIYSLLLHIQSTPDNCRILIVVLCVIVAQQSLDVGATITRA
jgi:hypothetical protein